MSLPAGKWLTDEFFRDLFEHAGDMIYATDLSGVITAINRAGERLTGFSRDELLGSNIARLVAPESLGDAMRMTDPETAGAAQQAYELEIVTKDDRRVTIEVRSRFLHRGGLPVGVQGIARDVSHAQLSAGAVRRRSLRIEAINEIIAAADAAPDLPTVIHVAVDRMLAVLEEPAGGVWIGGHAAARGLPPGFGHELPAALRGSGWEATAPHAVEDWAGRRSDELDVAAGMLWRGLGVRASLVVPIPLPEDHAGTLVVASPHPRLWRPEDVAFALEVARQIGATAEGLRLFRESRQRAELMARLVALNEVLHRSMSVAGVAAEIGAAALKLSGADRAAVYLRWPDGTATCAWRHGLSAEYVTNMLRPEIVRVWTERTAHAEPGGVDLPDGRRVPIAGPLLIADVAALPRTDIARECSEPEGFRAVAAWPLMYEGRVIASISCCYDAPHAWSKPEREIFQTFVWQAAAAVENARLFQAQRERTAELEALSESLEQSYIQIVLALARAMDARDAYTADHSERLAVWAEKVARHLGCGRDEALDVRWAALLHDIGKIGVPDGILLKPGPLTSDEWQAMQQHPLIGERILLPLERMRRVATIVRHHQERWDGSGYPDGLRGEAIPLLARVLAVVDTYSAIIDSRPYKPARSHDEAVAELERCAGTKFDPAVVATFRGVLAEGGRTPAIPARSAR
ncbi:MAG TPA: HD domain-containing phosphohydrolase [bacterium]|nr:HD domain-containing phosphohydrolase [bacterium]